MKRFSFIAFILVLTLVFGACVNGSRDSGDAVPEEKGKDLVPAVSEPDDPAPTEPDNSSPGTIVGYERVIRLKSGNTITYTGEKDQKIVVNITSDNSSKTVSTNIPSFPSLSLDEGRFAYLAPFEWEMLSEIFIYDFETGSNRCVLTLDDIKSNKNIRNDFTPKYLLWLDNRYLLAVIQYAYGTVTQGGDVYILDTEDNTIVPLIKTFGREEISELAIDGGFLLLDVNTLDCSTQETVKMKMAVTIDDIYEAIRYRRLIIGMFLAEDIPMIDKLLSEKKEPVFQPGAPFKEKKADLDGDGKDDVIKFQTIDEYRNEFFLSINDVKILGMGDNVEDNFYITDINTADGIKEIAVQEYGPSDDLATSFYYFNGKEIVFMGKIGGLAIQDGNIKGDGKLTATERSDFLQTWFYTKEYKLSDSHLLEAEKADFYENRYKDQVLVMKKQLKLYKSPGGSDISVTLNPGDKIRMPGSDAIEWCLAENERGQQGWFAVDGLTVRELDMDASEVFEGLCYAD